MYKCFFFFYLLTSAIALQAKCSDVSQQLRDTYSARMYEGFILQSQGKSTLAFYYFDSARDEAKKAGESPLKLAAIEQLFGWYRMYGSALNLFYKKPVGTDRIHGEYKARYSHPMGVDKYEGYESEWGKTPEQAARMRDFMLGVGEVISGVFCATVGTPFGGTLSFCLWTDGFSRMYNSLNYLWAGHEAKLYLKNCEQTTAKAVNTK